MRVVVAKGVTGIELGAWGCGNPVLANAWEKGLQRSYCSAEPGLGIGEVVFAITYLRKVQTLLSGFTRLVPLLNASSRLPPFVPATDKGLSAPITLNCVIYPAV